MTAAPASPPPDDKDWMWILSRSCPECAFDAPALDRAAIAALVRQVIEVFGTALAEASAAERPSPQVWSVLEYGCHIRDVCVLFDARLHLMLCADDPTFDNWDQDEAALASRYWEQEPAVVARELAAAADRIAGAFSAVAGDQWSRSGRRSNGSVFTIDTFGRYFVHDLVHHAHDIGRSVIGGGYPAASPPPPPRPTR
ncbi:MAG: DinB family protein [Jatrophihabitantaceae bacterium]